MENKSNKILQLLDELCPDGVEVRKLGEIAEITTGKLNANQNKPDGIYPFFTCDEKPYKIDTYAFDMEALLISGNGSKVGHVNYYNGKFNAYQRTYVLYNFKNSLAFYVFYYLKAYLRSFIQNKSKKASVPYITLPILQEFPIPLPPLAVQEEIVRSLDAYTPLVEELEAALKKELELRIKQYEYYREKLLTPTEQDGNWFLNGKPVEWKRLGEIGTFTRSKVLVKSDFTEDGVGCIHYGQIYTHYGTYTYNTISKVSPKTAEKLHKVNKGDLIITLTSEDVPCICKAVTWLGEEEIVSGGDSAIFKHTENPKFIAYFFQTNMFYNEKKKYAKGTKVIHMSVNDLEKIPISIPPLEEQERIVGILDKFETLVNDLKEGIPAEIELRRKQYEYYREKLLTFKIKES